MNLYRWLKKSGAVILSFFMLIYGVGGEAFAEDEDTLTGSIHVQIGDDFVGNTAHENLDVRDEKTGQFVRLQFKGVVDRKFDSGERVEIRRLRRLSKKEVELDDNGPIHIRRMQRNDSRQNFGPVRKIKKKHSALSQQSSFNILGGSGPSGAPPLVPAYSSNPSAPTKLFLDFDGHFESYWGFWQNATTPVYDRDGNAAAFSASELASIFEIWSRVSEDYAAFNIDVTTIDPGNQTPLVTAVIAIGGNSSDWYGGGGGGVAYVNGFQSTNVGYVFTANLGNGNPKYTAEAASHEAGHLFGLYHQSTWSGSTLVAQYNAGGGGWAPIMGNGYSQPRTTFHNGTSSNGPAWLQDDLAIISSPVNVFGYRTDDAGNGTGTASALPMSGGNVNFNGQLEIHTDADVWSFSTTGGVLNYQLYLSTYGPNLSPVLELLNSSGGLVISGTTSLSTNVGSGAYYLRVKSAGDYGDMGRYTITGTVPTSGGDTTAPVISAVTSSGITATGATIGWTTNEISDTQIEYGLTTAYGTSSVLSATQVTSHSQAITGLVVNTLYNYRVKSRDGSGNLATSGNYTFTTLPVANDPPVANDLLVDVGNGIAKDILLVASDPNNDTLTWNVVISPAHGTLTGSSPSLVFTPDVGYAGADYFTFKVNDGQIDSNVAIVNITISVDSVLPIYSGSAQQVIKNVLDPSRGESATINLRDVTIPTSVTLRVFDRRGEMVRQVNTDVSPGSSIISWDGRNDSNRTVSSGTYYLKIQYDSKNISKTVVVIK